MLTCYSPLIFKPVESCDRQVLKKIVTILINSIKIISKIVLFCFIFPNEVVLKEFMSN